MTTTTSAPPTSARRHTIVALNRCIEICTDAEKGWAIAAADVRDETLKLRFLARVKERSDFVVELQKAVLSLGATPENEGSVKGALHRGFMTAVRVAEGRSDKLVVEQCIRGEQAALAGYENALRGVYFHRMPVRLRAIVDAQYSTIKRSLEDLRESYAV
jgi:uncharacterized protein (TIGR02284 family)